ncbi:hypothetical protein SAMN05421752_10926 [Natronorubrum thiooxidans]|uniref:Uncharacterized protein n=1 Tax=Natronorubrum thiooxidans TaxID=308853 RepID=A0A1N7FZ31_9EURY|nr:hypothetical protein SAMN05421752_10926 [Natronorubrum thiooxidans]
MESHERDVGVRLAQFGILVASRVSQLCRFRGSVSVSHIDA